MLFEDLLCLVFKDLIQTFYPTSFNSSGHSPLQTIGPRFTNVPQYAIFSKPPCFVLKSICASPGSLICLIQLLLLDSAQVPVLIPQRIFPVIQPYIWFQIILYIPIKHYD